MMFDKQGILQILRANTGFYKFYMHTINNVGTSDMFSTITVLVPHLGAAFKHDCVICNVFWGARLKFNESNYLKFVFH